MSFTHLLLKEMELKAKLMHMCRVLTVAVAAVGVVAADKPLSLALPGCNSTCGGDVVVPYPFGIGNSSIPDQGPCFLEPKFELTCNGSELNIWGNLTVLKIDILLGQLELSSYIGWSCGGRVNKSFYSWLKTGSFSISSKQNKFLTVGCDGFGYLNSAFDGEIYTTGCLTKCYNYKRRIENGTCSGIGCCQVDIPPRMRNITVHASEFPNSTETSGSCSYSFVVKQGFYNFSTTHLRDFRSSEFPLILDWSIGNQTCSTAAETGVHYACRNNSYRYCDNEDLDYGYRCKCKPGYAGNPYHPDGCLDIDECKNSTLTCIDENHCRNTDGSYECFCPEGQSGNGTKEGGCHRQDVLTKVAIGACAGFIILFVGTSLMYMIYQRRKLIKLKEKFFHQNGGFILLRQLSTREETSGTVQIFTEDELKKATNNFDESLIIGKGGFGTVFKGILADNKIIAVKKSKIMDASQVEQFINEVVVLSQINHRNVVKLLGCCLETEVPLLVYEFVSNGTLFDFIHNKEKEINETWKTRLRIAAETAGALSYLHSAASIPIIHRDVKSSNILLDDNYSAKVSDFGASRLVPLDQIEIATMVQGTLGYLDPEYMQTQQLTERSDVYSFGVVLAELLTGEKPISFDREKEKRSLAMHFLSCLKGDRIFEVLQVGILDEDNKDEIKEVAFLVAKCLRLKGEERPTMKEVAMDLEGIRLMDKDPWIDTDINFEETRYLLPKASSSIYETGDSSNHRYSEYDSLNAHASFAIDDGR